jgi:hypothetical protein
LLHPVNMHTHTLAWAASYNDTGAGGPC